MSHATHVVQLSQVAPRDGIRGRFISSTVVVLHDNRYGVEFVSEQGESCRSPRGDSLPGPYARIFPLPPRTIPQGMCTGALWSVKSSLTEVPVTLGDVLDFDGHAYMLHMSPAEGGVELTPYFEESNPQV